MARSDLRWMPKVRRLIGARGATFTDFLSNHPLCCPARAEILTGQLAQNNGVHSNEGRLGGYTALRDPDNHIGAWLQESGYRTAMVGKHLNHWSGQQQDGWTIFNPSLHNVYSPYGVTMYNDGNPRKYPRMHTSDVMGRLTVEYIKQLAASDAPFFIWTSQLAPHGMLVGGKWKPPVPARRHRNLYPNARPPSFRSPSFNEWDVSDKPRYVRRLPKVATQEITARYLARIRSLRSIDDQVGNAVEALAEAGELQNTFLVFTSDNGWSYGEHRLTSKNTPYEESLQVPLVVRGPGVPSGTNRLQTFALTDLAPTFVELAGATPGRTMDGRSMSAALTRNAPGYSHYLIQATRGRMTWWWRGVRSKGYVYVRYTDGFEELYDMRRDPAQLRNRARDRRYAKVRADYRARLRALETCVGQVCQAGGA